MGDVCEAFVEMLRRGSNSTLKCLSVCGEQISDAAVVQISQLLTDTPLLTSLELRSEAMGDESSQAIADALRISTTLTSLSLFGSGTTGDSCTSIIEALRANVTLVALKLDIDWDLDDAYYNEYDCGAATEDALLDCLACNLTVTRVDIKPSGFNWDPAIID